MTLRFLTARIELLLSNCLLVTVSSCGVQRTATAQLSSPGDTTLLRAISTHMAPELRGERLVFNREVYCGLEVACHDATPRMWDSATVHHILPAFQTTEDFRSPDQAFSGPDRPTVVLNLGPIRQIDVNRQILIRLWRSTEISIRRLTLTRRGDIWVVSRDELVGGT